MRKRVLSLMSVLTLSGMAYGGGDIAPVDAVPVVPIINESAFYLGLGMGGSSIDDAQTDEEISSVTVLLQAGYQYNQYIAVEGRIWLGFNTDYDPGNTTNIGGEYDNDISSWGIYIKPMYPVSEVFDVYTLLGYGGTQLGNLEKGDAYENSFQWGIGAQYEVMENVILFADYVRLYDGKGFDYRAQDEDVDADVWTIGLSYRF